MRTIRRIIFVLLVVSLIGGYFFYDWVENAYYERMNGQGKVEFIIAEGEDIREVAKRLEEEGLIERDIIFLWGAWRGGSYTQVRSGSYQISRDLSPLEVMKLFTKKGSVIEEVKITFPEGWTAKKMSERLTKNGLPGEEFLKIINAPGDDITRVRDYLSYRPEKDSLEGYLFPDTYIFSAGASAQDIVITLLDTFERKVLDPHKASIEVYGGDLHDMLIMASIIEMEVRSDKDRKTVSGIFQNRIDIGMALQSDATLAYVLQTGKIQHSAEDLAVDSLYNSYKYPGLPPGPIANPSLSAINAALHPEETAYLYFLSDPKTGETYFAQTFEQHKINKARVGL